MNLKTWRSLITLNQASSQIDRTRFRQKLIPESISQPVLVSQRSTYLGLEKMRYFCNQKLTYTYNNSNLDSQIPFKPQSRLRIPYWPPYEANITQIRQIFEQWLASRLRQVPQHTLILVSSIVHPHFYLKLGREFSSFLQLTSGMLQIAK